MTKRCPKCGERKPVESFGKNRSMRDGLQGWCKPCTAIEAKSYRKANRAARTQYNKEWRAANPDGVAKHAEAHKDYQKKYYEKNKELVLARNRAYVEANRGKVTAKRSEWSRINGSGHRARCKRFGVPYTPINKTAIFERDGWICGICGDPVDKKLKWPDLYCATLDHIIALSLGPLAQGCGHVEENVQLAHFLCNLAKRNEYDVESALLQPN
jgi:5-methylcytosine-specific restriction endonuclease McrA